MRIKNKEIRRRRHRKEQKVKAADKLVRAEFSERKATAPVAKPKAAQTKKAAPAKTPAKPKPAPKAKTAEVEAE